MRREKAWERKQYSKKCSLMKMEERSGGGNPKKRRKINPWRDNDDEMKIQMPK